MRTLEQIAEKMTPLWIGLLCAASFPHSALADGNDKNESKAPTKIEAPAPLTERERWLLDRMEQLEKRVAELEAKGSVPAGQATETEASQPARASSAATNPENERSVTEGTPSAAWLTATSISPSDLSAGMVIGGTWTPAPALPVGWAVSVTGPVKLLVVAAVPEF